MISSSEKRKLLEQYRDPIYARAAIVKAVAGLLIVLGVALVGTTSPLDADQTAGVSSQQVAKGR